MNKFNEISIKQHLAKKNIFPVKNYGHYGLYHCPFRSDHNASFKVDYRKNVWHDFGTNKGGTLIDLVMQMENCSFHKAALTLEKEYTSGSLDFFSFHWTDISEVSENATITIRNIIPITHPKLIAWVRERTIDLDLANQYCREIHYQNNTKNYFSIGFANDNGGYELSSPPNFKGCIPLKAITTFRNSHDSCLVFEGFWDFLSYLTLQKIDKTRHDIAVLNSVANVRKAMDFLKTHREIYTYLDNDESGRKATALIQQAHPTVHNRSVKFAPYKDLNDFVKREQSLLADYAERRNYRMKFNDYLCQKPIAN